MATRRKGYDDPFGYDDPGYMMQDSYPMEPDPNDPSHGAEPGGVAGPRSEGTPQPPTQAPAPPPVQYNQGSTVGLDTGKFNDPNKHDFKYDVMRTLSKYDPRKGFSGDVLTDLNTLGYGDFYSSGGDRLSLKNAKNAKDAADFNDQDWIYAFDANNDATKWNFGGGGSYQEPSLPEGNAKALGIPGYQPAPNYGGGGGGGTTTYTSRPSFDANTLKEALAGLFPNGAFNQNTVNRNVDNIRGGIEKARKSRLATNQALLAERGLIGSGPESSAYQNMDEDLFNAEVSGINDAYSHEYDQASSRMMQALQIAAGMTAEEARNAVDWFNAQTGRQTSDNNYNLGLGQLANQNRQTDLGFLNSDRDFTLGRGNLALANSRNANDYNLALGRLGLDRDALQYQLQNQDVDRLIQIVNQLYGGAQASAGGYR